jgi:hypothetical protein
VGEPRSFTTSVVHGALQWRAKMMSWPTQRPTTTFRSVPASFSRRACATGLHIASVRSGTIFGSESSSFSTPATLQQAAVTSKRGFSTSASTFASSARPMQKAMPRCLKPISSANRITSSTRVSRL